MLDGIFASDIAGDPDASFEVMEHPAEMPLMDFFFSVMRRIRDSDADYGVRLEDDVVMGKHFIHNIKTWPALRSPSFGAGWLFASKGMREDMLRIRRDQETRELYRPTREIHCALAVLLPVGLMREGLYERMEEVRGTQDFAMSAAVWEMRRKCFLHWPPLVENMMIESVRGHHNHTAYGHSANGCFDPEYRR